MRYEQGSVVACGRLAQLVEHLVYTERVGGSSPSPPTRMRGEMAACGLARSLVTLLASVAVAASLLGWSTLARAATEPMAFHLDTIASPAACKKHCDRLVSADVISAEGAITNDTADEFLAFLQQHLGDQELRPVVLIHSPGGTVVGAMKLGLMFRKIGAAVIVARAVGEQGSDRAHVVPGACMSACVYAFFGGKRRVIPPVSRLGIHRMAIYAHSHDPAGGEQVTRTYGTDDLVTALSDYTKQMGIDPEVIDEAEQIAPESIHIVTSREILRWRLGSPRL